jgi:hypothetical protein
MYFRNTFAAVLKNLTLNENKSFTYGFLAVIESEQLGAITFLSASQWLGGLVPI